MKPNSILAVVLMTIAGGASAIDLADLQTFNTSGIKALSVVTVPAANNGYLTSARTYDFKKLYKSLGYPSPDYFGASRKEIRDLEIYTSKEDANYKEINGYLRFYPGDYEWYGLGPKQAKVIVKNVDSLFTRVPSLPGDLMLFRGLNLKFRENKSYELNEEFVDKGYISTSVDFSVAKYFAVEKDDDGNPIDSLKAVFVLYFNRPGEKGILIDSEEENEVLLGHGMNFRIMGKKETGEKYDLYLAQACSGPCETSLRQDVREFWNNFDPKTATVK